MTKLAQTTQPNGPLDAIDRAILGRVEFHSLLGFRCMVAFQAY